MEELDEEVRRESSGQKNDCSYFLVEEAEEVLKR